ncbi:hypothetical protein [Halorubrum sp. 48-1-W]|uniref:hypothetical protein n=1 Tax=Halorubrum sp. 48-1-W TaxID=2249761 RepID=UPI001F53F796|nr:hypothetical protein [Halorubrum sp. 48-1-W]
MYVPEDPPDVCPACGEPYESVSRHAGGFVVALHDNERYRRVCFHPATTASGDPALDCYHHAHGQVDRAAEGSRSDEPDPVRPTERS